MLPAEMQESDGGIRDVNVTPLIDVSLVLVVMLLLATPLAFESSIKVSRADATAKSADQPDVLERVEISILSESVVLVNARETSREGLGTALEPLLRGEAPPPVVVTCAPQVSHGAFVSVLDEAKANGAVEIAVVGGAT